MSTTLIARHTIHITKTPGRAADPEKKIAAVKPVIRVIKPGTRFVLSDPAHITELTTGLSPAALVVSSEVEETVDLTQTDDEPKPARKARATKAAAAPASGGEGDDGMPPV